MAVRGFRAGLGFTNPAGPVMLAATAKTWVSLLSISAVEVVFGSLVMGPWFI